jgi:hypothetical protein
MTRKRAKSADQNVVWVSGDDGTAGSTAQPTYGFPGIPSSAIVRAVSGFIWGMSG